MACPCSPTWCTLTATWQLPTLPNVPEYCRSTPTECSPCLAKPVSSITHAASGSNSAVIRFPSNSHYWPPFPRTLTHQLLHRLHISVGHAPGQRLYRFSLTVQQHPANVHFAPVLSFTAAQRL